MGIAHKFHRRVVGLESDYHPVGSFPSEDNVRSLGTRMVRPGLMLVSKLNKYSQRYGFLALIPRYLGRQSPRTWRYIGQTVTKHYLNAWKNNGAPKILNLAGGGNCIEGCLTVDIDPRADAYVDIAEPLPFSDNSIDAVFSEEAIEHVSKESGRRVLEECYRILRPSGVLRITTPDLDYFARKALAEVECDEINDIFYLHNHAYLYTRKALQHACTQTGFVNLRESSYKDPHSKLGYLDSHADRFGHSPEISQYVEIEKPKDQGIRR